ncbi:extracellular calcium-sensing receptor-like [Protopterus annectens]|uniref:extracellular calcium-sensing receptor-like n=1 Tax=Protopterus annectens TaxID=7888 RepID=UPI001CF955D8|nr:extracellular calcium-sensing receptor-like [Protopterus annectens]
MMFTIEEINAKAKLLPNVTLGYMIYDTCATTTHSQRATFTIVHAKYNNGFPAVPAIVGDYGSTQSMALERALFPYKTLLVSYFASCACLSNRQQFPTFFRTIPNDAHQVKALAQFVHKFNWTWIGVIGGDDDYGQYGIKYLADEVKSWGGCVAFTEIIPKVISKENLQSIVTKVKMSSAKVIVMFAIEADAYPVLQEAAFQNLTGKQWIASEAWVTSTLIATDNSMPFLEGTVGFAILRAEISGLKEFLLNIHPGNHTENMFVKEFWETMFECSLETNTYITADSSLARYNRTCTGLEDLQKHRNIYTDTSHLRVSYNIYKAVHAVAHALQLLYSCVDGHGPFIHKNCANKTNLQPWQVQHYMKDVHFTSKSGDEVQFDENGDPVAAYDILNWQRDGNNFIQFIQVGHFNASLILHENLMIHEEKIIWNEDSKKVPKSVCSYACKPGKRKAMYDGKPICCYDCVACSDGSISNETDALICIQCAQDYWHNEQKNRCIQKQIDFLSFDDPLGISLTSIAVCGALLTILVALLFTTHRSTPIVRANNCELSFLLLFSLIMCFLCSLSFIGPPNLWTCLLKHTVFSVSFVLCVSCILAKTIVVIIAFKATLPDKNIMKWFGPKQQRCIVFFCTLIQIVICVLWITVSPPLPVETRSLSRSKIILECNLGSVFLFWGVMSYLGFLSCLCFLLAFFARNLPNSFNEAKYITFSMITFFVVWIAFIPSYISSPGKYASAIEIFAILSSSFGLLLCIFAPKCYIILGKPQSNTKKYLIAKSTVRP